jgi:superfamily II DNA or RNA helicase
MKKRKHQQEITEIARRIRYGESVRNILAFVTQGGGKSAIAQIMASELAEPCGYKICWVVPRDNLRAQGVDNFSRNDMRELFGNTMPLIEAHNQTRLDDLDVGYVTTYQAIVADPAIHQKRMGQGKWILILDECHHIPAPGADGDEAAYYEHIAPLVELASVRVFATGSLVRHDDQRIAFLPYQEAATGWIVNEDPGGDWVTIKYLRVDAEAESAVVPVEFRLIGGEVSWQEKDGRIVRTQIRTAHITEVGPAINAAIETDLALRVLDRTVEDWKEKKKSMPWAKLLVIAPSVDLAEKYAQYLRHTHRIAAIRADYEVPQAKRRIERFRGKEKPEVDTLVTVAMAYEGLDEPRITHVCLLTNIRSSPWIEQASTRCNRTRRGKEAGYVFTLDDPLMARCMTYMEHQGGTFIPERNKEEKENGFEGERVRSYTPLGSEIGTTRVIKLGREAKRKTEDLVTLDLLNQLLPRVGDDQETANAFRLAMQKIEGKEVDSGMSLDRNFAKIVRNRFSYYISVMAGNNQQKRIAIMQQIKLAHDGRKLRELSVGEILDVLKLLAVGKLPIITDQFAE